MNDGSLGLIAAAVAALRADATLVALVGHDATAPEGYRIGRDSPVVAERTPFVGVRMVQSAPLTRTADVTHLQRSLVAFTGSARSELTANQIVDRIESLLHWAVEADVTRQPNTGSWPWPSADVTVRQTRFSTRGDTEYESDKKVWAATLEAVVVWFGYNSLEV